MYYILFILYPLALYRSRLIIAALVLHAGLIISSAITYGRIPLIGLHDTLGFLTFFICVIFLITSWSRGRDLFSYLSLALMLLLLAGSAASPVMDGPLPPVLKTIWFELHVILSFIAYALFAVAAVLGILHLVQQEEASEPIQYRLILLGYVLFSVAIIFGGIWAHLAWGAYWLWTPKELWTTIVWLWYSLYLHARLVRGWTGKPVAWMGIIGFVIVLFTYVGVGLLMKSSHEF
ncbi:MAG: hypothetical protein A2X56_04850 [Nitrospirae bacterium GWC2_57_13]|nr:MAG: hypothetical protein A2X56_04850 [Nitrospirae bacterium GWC2_57_13]